MCHQQSFKYGKFRVARKMMRDMLRDSKRGTGMTAKKWCYILLLESIILTMILLKSWNYFWGGFSHPSVPAIGWFGVLILAFVSINGVFLVQIAHTREFFALIVNVVNMTFFALCVILIISGIFLF